MQVFFITRKYPPSIGGMEAFSYYLFSSLRKFIDVRLIGGSYPWWALPYLSSSALYQVLRHNLAQFASDQHAVIHCADAALAPLASTLSRFSNAKAIVTAHGLDVTHAGHMYRHLVVSHLRRIDGVACDSEYTSRLSLSAGVRPSRVRVIQLAVDTSMYMPMSRDKSLLLLEDLRLPSLSERVVIMTVGRLVPRKGVLWFIENVMPVLAARLPSVLYIVVGEGSNALPAQRAILRLGLSKQVIMLGGQDLESIRAISSWATAFIAPNIKCESDPEGFGLVTLEARALGLPVIASEVDGLGESILNGKDGLLAGTGDVNSFLEAIEYLIANRDRLWPASDIRERMLREFSWDKVARTYVQFYHDVQAGTV
ncbi:MAG: glycosyltransferase family 4 protein [Chloroflexi bacterium]|nr:glycosyltransferase family 4 protein [Chloroflexota bacterium]